jgi:hypothetical protein
MDYQTRSDFQIILLAVLVVFIGTGVWELAKPERGGRSLFGAILLKSRSTVGRADLMMK